MTQRVIALLIWFLGSHLVFVLNELPNGCLLHFTIANLLQTFSLVGLLLSRKKTLRVIFGLCFMTSVYFLQSTILKDLGSKIFLILNTFLVLILLNTLRDEQI